MMTIIGVLLEDKKQRAEIAAYCDDLAWSFPLTHPYDYNGKHSNVVRTDCLWPSNVIRMWASETIRGRFRVGASPLIYQC